MRNIAREQISACAKADVGHRFRTTLVRLRLLAHEIDDGGEVVAAVALLGEVVVDFGGLRAERGLGFD